MKHFKLAPLGLGILIGAVVATAGLSAAVKIFSVETASATAGTGFTSTILARGVIAENLVFGTPKAVTVKRKVKFKYRGRTFSKTLNVRVASLDKAITCNAASPCDTAYQQGTLQPGGTTGWHTHPGPTFVAFAQGDGTVYHDAGSSCPAMKIGAGSGFTQMPALTHVLKNDGSVPIIVYTLYLLPHGTPNSGIRIDQPQPTACPSIN